MTLVSSLADASSFFLPSGGKGGVLRRGGWLIEKRRGWVLSKAEVGGGSWLGGCLRGGLNVSLRAEG